MSAKRLPVKSSKPRSRTLGVKPQRDSPSKLRRGRAKKNDIARRVTPFHRYVLRKPWLDLIDVKATRELKNYTSNRVSEVVYASPDSSLAGEFVSLNQVYRFRLGGHGTISSDGSNICDGHYACDPSASGVNFPEWTTLASLFSEFRLVSFSAQFVTRGLTGNYSTTIIPHVMMIAGNIGTAVNPGSYAALADNADSKMWSFAQDTSPLGYTHTIHATGIGWSQVTTPTVTPYAGAPGSIQYYCDSAAKASIAVVDVLITGIYEFRSRV